MPRALLVDVHGSADLREAHAGGQTIERLVGGDLLALQSNQPGGWHAYIDANGPARLLPIDRAGTRLAKRLGWKGRPGEALVGPMLFLGETEDGGEADLPVEQLSDAVRCWGLDNAAEGRLLDGNAVVVPDVPGPV